MRAAAVILFNGRHGLQTPHWFACGDATVAHMDRVPPHCAELWLLPAPRVT